MSQRREYYRLKSLASIVSLKENEVS